MLQVILFASGLAVGAYVLYRICRREIGYWESRVRELERREKELLATVLELRRSGYEAPPVDERWEPFVMTDEYAARVAAEREARGEAHDELVRMVVPD